MENKDVIQRRVWNTKQMVIAVSLAISLTFSATMIWARFLYVETYVETVDDRYRKVTDRLIIRVEKLEESNINNHGE